MRILVFKKWFTVTKLNGCLIYEDWRSFLKRNKPLSKGTRGHAGRGCPPWRWAKVGRAFLCKASPAAGREQPVQKEKLMSERRLEMPGWGWRVPDPGTPLRPRAPRPRRLSTSTSRGSRGARQRPVPLGGTQAEKEHCENNATVHRASVSVTRSSYLQLKKKPL